MNKIQLENKHLESKLRKIVTDHRGLEDKHRHVKHRMLRLLEDSGKTNWTKDAIRDEIMKVFKEIK